NLYLLGYPLGTDGTPSSTSLSTISLNDIGGKGEPTTKMSIDANLDAGAEGVSGYDPKDSLHNMEGGQVTPDFQTNINVYDSLGGTQPLKISYVKLDTPANTWAYEVHYDGDAGNITPAVNPIATGTLTFNTDGTLKDVTDTTGSTPVDSPDGTVNMVIPWNSASGLAAQTVAFN